ncbi:MAG: LptF/LptG family permease [Sphaerochaetaceae bacterium]|jgi:lipopolysaccharide export system permease protein
MKTVDRYTLFNILKNLVSSLLLLSFVILLFDTFKDLETYLHHNATLKEIALIAWYGSGDAVILALAPSLLFSVTYTLSSLHAYNEMIVLYNSGFSFRRVVRPIIIVGVLLVFFQFFFSEYVALSMREKRVFLIEEVTQEQPLQDNRNISVQDPTNSYMIHAQLYSESEKSLYGVSVLTYDEGVLKQRLDASSAHYTGSHWVFKDVIIYYLNVEPMSVRSITYDTYEDEEITINPSFFRNVLADIEYMKLESALLYTQQLKRINYEQYRYMATDVYDRLAQNLNPLLLVIISIATLFPWKKNILVLSIIVSLLIAVVYFVLHMVTIIFAKQGIITPMWGGLAPALVLLFLAFLISLVKRIIRV